MLAWCWNNSGSHLIPPGGFLSHVDFVSFSLRIQEESEETPPIPMSLFLRPEFQCASSQSLSSSRVFPAFPTSFSFIFIFIFPWDHSTTHILCFSIFKKPVLTSYSHFFFFVLHKKKYPKSCLLSLTPIQFLSRRAPSSQSLPLLSTPCLGHQALTYTSDLSHQPP